MEARKLLDALHVAEKLKDETRIIGGGCHDALIMRCS